MKLFVPAFATIAFASIGACDPGPVEDNDEDFWPGAEIHAPFAESELRARKLADGTVVEYRVVDGEVVIGGDMLYGPVDEFERKLAESTSFLVAKDHARWKMPIRYTFDNDTPEATKDAVAQAMDRLVAQSGADIRFQRCTGSCPVPRIKFDYDGQGCSSPVGRQALGNKIHLDTWCNGISSSSTVRDREIVVIMHEIMHSLGVQHEQTRCDRNNHVTVFKKNIDTKLCGKANITARHCSRHDDLGSYDFDSVMHYSSTACAKPGKRTIDSGSASKNARMGQRSSLSTGDRAGLRAMYP